MMSDDKQTDIPEHPNPEEEQSLADQTPPDPEDTPEAQVLDADKEASAEGETEIIMVPRAYVADLGEDIDSEVAMHYLWMLWADFHLSVTWPIIAPIDPPEIIMPSIREDDGKTENVYPILDLGYKLSTSRGGEGVYQGYALNRYYNTIDKMITMLLERIKSSGELSAEDEIRVAFEGFILGQRKGFESILNLEENVLVVNFDPGDWGERYMKNVLEMVERGYGMPKAAPRTRF